MTLDVLAHKAALEPYFRSIDGVVLAYLFGSHARGRAGPLSDVDVAVLLAGAPTDDRCFGARLEIIGGLMDILHANDVDVLVLNQAPAALRYRVLRDGQLLFCGAEQARIDFTVRTVGEYLDLKPMIERHERAILERAAKGELFHGYNPHRGALERYRRTRERLKRAAKPHL
jgi:hypothetical protein